MGLGGSGGGGGVECWGVREGALVMDGTVALGADGRGVLAGRVVRWGLGSRNLDCRELVDAPVKPWGPRGCLGRCPCVDAAQEGSGVSVLRGGLGWRTPVDTSSAIWRAGGVPSYSRRPGGAAASGSGPGLGACRGACRWAWSRGVAGAPRTCPMRHRGAESGCVVWGLRVLLR